MLVKLKDILIGILKVSFRKNHLGSFSQNEGIKTRVITYDQSYDQFHHFGE